MSFKDAEAVLNAVVPQIAAQRKLPFNRKIRVGDAGGGIKVSADVVEISPNLFDDSEDLILRLTDQIIKAVRYFDRRIADERHRTLREAREGALRNFRTVLRINPESARELLMEIVELARPLCP